MTVYEHNPGDHEDPLPGPTWLIGILSVILLAVIIMGVSAMYYTAYDRADVESTVDRPVDEFENLKQQQLAQIVDEPRRQEFVQGMEVVERVIIPLDDAMDQVIEEHGQP